MPFDYEIRVRGRVDDDLAEALGLRAHVEPVVTALRGPFPDQRSLHVLLGRLQDLGIELVEIRRLPSAVE